MANQHKFDKTDRWMMIGSAICLTFMLLLTYFVAESMREEHDRMNPVQGRVPASVLQLDERRTSGVIPVGD